MISKYEELEGGSEGIGKCVVIDRHVRISRRKGGLVNKAKVDMLM